MTKNNICQYQLNNDLTASDNLKFEFAYDQATGKHGYYDAQGTFVPFKNPTGNKSITISSTGTTSGIDVADYATASITTSGLYKPSGTKYIYSNGTYDVNSYSSASVNVPTGITLTDWTFDVYIQGHSSGAQYATWGKSTFTIPNLGWKTVKITHISSLRGTPTTTPTLGVLTDISNESSIDFSFQSNTSANSDNYSTVRVELKI